MSKSTREVLADNLYDYLVNDEELSEILCEGCKLYSRSEGCPVDYDFFDRHCPQNHVVRGFWADIHRLCENVGLRP